MEVVTPITHYQRYRESIKACVKRHYETNLEYRAKTLERSKEINNKRYDFDPEFRERKKQDALKRYYAKKLGIPIEDVDLAKLSKKVAMLASCD